MPDENPTVYIVDDDPDFRESMSLLVRSMGLGAAVYPSAEAFLDDYSESSNSPKCMVLDVRMSGLSGLGLQQMLVANGKGMPIIMISGSPTFLWQSRPCAGALDFLEKPVSCQTLSVCIRAAIDHDVRQRRNANRKTELVRHTERLSARQREVLDLLVAGQRSKQIARELGIGEKTVAKHRSAVLERMSVNSVVELVHLFANANLTCVVG